jgi:hypothetical protein
MDEQVKAKVLEWLQALEDGAKTEIPAYCQEVVGWYFWNEATLAVQFALMPLLGVLAAFLVKRLIAKAAQIYQEAKEVELMFTIGACGFLALIGSLSLSSALFHAREAVKACAAPRVVIIEHLRGIVR